MIRKIDIFSLAFCMACGGFCYVISDGFGYIDVLSAAICYLVVMFLYYKLVSKSEGNFNWRLRRYTGKIGVLAFGGFALISASVNSIIVSRLISGSVFDGKNYYTVLIVTASLALIIALASSLSRVRLGVIVFVITAILLIVIAVLALSKVSLNKLFIPIDKPKSTYMLMSVVAFDMVTILPFMKKEHGYKPVALGGFILGVYFGLTALLTTFTLAPDLLECTVMPTIMLWQTTYIAAFINHFEIFALCAMLLCSIVKISIALSSAIRAVHRENALFIFIAFLIICMTAPLLFIWYEIFSVLTVIFGLALPLYLVLRG